MSVRIEVREGEDLAGAARRFKEQVRRRLRCHWAKRRYGFYQKPSELRRRRRDLERQSRRLGRTSPGSLPLLKYGFLRND